MIKCDICGCEIDADTQRFSLHGSNCWMCQEQLNKIIEFAKEEMIDTYSKPFKTELEKEQKRARVFAKIAELLLQ